jgi:hypothetical protein
VAFAGSDEAERLFDELVAGFSGDASVTPPSGGKGGKFGASALKHDGRIFAMISGGHLVVKLPRARVEELVASGVGGHFDPGHGRVMKEWATIPTHHAARWPELAREALRFVAAAPSSRRGAR